MIDPLKEFSKIVEVMSVDLDLSRLRVATREPSLMAIWLLKKKFLGSRILSMSWMRRQKTD
jgi:hypothetical protein